MREVPSSNLGARTSVVTIPRNNFGIFTSFFPPATIPVMNNSSNDIIVIYHAQCRDGFASAFAAWKKFGDSATYVPQRTQVAVAEYTNKVIYVLDYGLEEDVQRALENTNQSVVVIDHHPASEAGVTAFPQNIFDPTHSGAVLSWQYFHPDTPVPELMYFVEDHDLWKFEMEDNRAFCSALKEYDFDFKKWDDLMSRLEDPAFRNAFINKGQIISQFEDNLVEGLMQYKERVRFEGHEVWALNVARTYRSILGHHLAKLNAGTDQPEIGIVYYRNLGAVNISLRSNGDANVRVLAEKYGGGGHDNAASIKVDSFKDLPFEFIEE